MFKRKHMIFRYIAALAFIGVVLSVYSFLHKLGFASGELCNFSDTFNCDIVNQGPYSEIFGIPVALLGIIGYGFLLVGALLKLRQPSDRTLSIFLLFASICGFLFALYLTSIEAFILHAWCIICVSSQLAIALILVLLSIYFIKEKR